MSLTIQQFLRYLAPEYVGKKKFRCPEWPVDLFAIAAALLEKSGGYAYLGTELCPFENCFISDKKNRSAALSRLGDDWKLSLSNQIKKQTINTHTQSRLPWENRVPVPQRIFEWWSIIKSKKKNSVSSIPEDRDLLAALINLVAVTDETMALVGSRIHADDSSSLEQDFWEYCGNLLHPFEEDGSSLCYRISKSRLRVLPKSQTPAGGLSLRSLTHYLALCPPLNIPAFWYSEDIPHSTIHENYCNILLIPWPFELFPSQFNAVIENNPSCQPDARRFSFHLEEDEAKNEELLRVVYELIEKAEKQIGHIHLIVFPELSLSRSQFNLLTDRLKDRNKIIIAGIQDNTTSSQGLDSNVAITSFPTDSEGVHKCYEQQKHHRWKLDKDQIIRYGLTSKLDPEYQWWEGIEIKKRRINFMRPKPWLSLCVLICEDLAQFDPVGRFVRSVGPDLVIALLMDGPQLKSRWSARYATILADDPGSAVITLTSLGMDQLSRELHDTANPVPKTIALWKDPIEGIVPINLPAQKQAAIITARRVDEIKWTADGRQNDLKLGRPVFGGVQFI